MNNIPYENTSLQGKFVPSLFEDPAQPGLCDNKELA